MKKFLTLFAVCFMVLGAKWAMADSRTDSLGLTPGQQVDDLDSIWLYPQNAANFGNLVDNRMGTSANSAVLTPTNDWFGIIAQEWQDLGYIGVYTNRPFDQSNGIVPSSNPADQFGILDGSFGTWDAALSPFSTFTNAIADNGGHITATYVPHGLALAITNPENKLDAFWAKSFSDATLGVHVNYASQNIGNISNSETYVANPPAAGSYLTTTNNAYTGVLGIDLGLGVKNFILWDNLDLGVGYSMGSVNYSSVYNQENTAQNATVALTDYTEKDHGVDEIRVNGLGVSKISDTTSGRTYLNIRIDNLGVNSTTNTTSLAGVNNALGDQIAQTNAYSDLNINLGYALSHKVLDGKALVIASLTGIFDDRKWTYTAAENAGGSTSETLLGANSGESEELSALVIPFNVAIETPLFDWMKARIGVSKNIFVSATEKIVQPTNINGAGTAFQTNNVGQESEDPGTLYQNINTFAGVGMSFSNFTLDFQINPTNLLTALNGLAPGDGLIYGQSTSGQNNSVINQLWTTIAQFDMRYAF